jgi:hypothetical protein
VQSLRRNLLRVRSQVRGNVGGSLRVRGAEAWDVLMNDQRTVFIPFEIKIVHVSQPNADKLGP